MPILRFYQMKTMKIEDKYIPSVIFRLDWL